jgi:hypothetical protein
MSMCVENTPLERYPQFGLVVKREDLCCPGGPNFSKCRGVYAHIARCPESVIGVLDTSHSQGGWAVAKACKMLGKQCVEFYPAPKATPGWLGEVQHRCRELAAETIPLSAGRSAILYRLARKRLGPGGYMVPNALKLPESVSETAAEVERTKLPDVETALVSASSGTIAAGVILGLRRKSWPATVIVHLGYSRPQSTVRAYIASWLRPFVPGPVCIVDEGYKYSDVARPGPTPPFPSDPFYDRKAVVWWMKEGRSKYGSALLWLIG